MDDFKQVRVEFALKDIPGLGSRTFVDTLRLQPSHDFIYLQEVVRGKLQVVGCEESDFEVLMGEYFVDTMFFDELVSDLFNPQPKISRVQHPPSNGAPALLGIGGSSTSAPEAPHQGWRFDVTIKQKRLTKDTLQRMTSESFAPPASVSVDTIPIHSLAAGLVRGRFRVEGRVRSVRKKFANICEVELVDVQHPQVSLTMITFSQAKVDHLLAMKPGNCYEVKNVQCQAKNARDIQFATNTHTMKLVADDGTEIRPISDPLPNYRAMDELTTIIGSKTARDAATMRHSDSGDLDTASSSAVFTVTHNGSEHGLLASTSGSSATPKSQSGMGRVPRMTLLQRPPSSANSVLPSPVQPVLPQATVTPVRSQEVPSVHITARDAQLEMVVAEEEAAQMASKGRRVEADATCILCGYNLSEARDRADMMRRLNLWAPGSFKVPPTFKELRSEMRDRRAQIPGYREDVHRLYCRATFVHPMTKKLHRIHCRCAHLAREYQAGSNISAVVINAEMADCSICGEPGATVSCVHPECKKKYHTLCAILSKRVDFDQRDPYLPKPSCPSHTNPAVSRRRPVTLVWESAEGEDSVGQSAAFDSAVVYRHDLRDPDDDSWV